MTTEPLYLRDSYRRKLTTQVVQSHAGRTPWVVLADTILYPEGGGQPADRGWINGIKVLDVKKQEGLIRHFPEQLPESETVEVELDWERRFDHMQQHTAQHLLTALAADRFGWTTTSFHLGSERSDIELTVLEPSPDQIQELEELAAQAIRDNLPVRPQFVTADQIQTMSVRSRGLPEDHQGHIRLVEIEGIDLNTCGGTHVSSTGHLETIKLLGTESLRGGTRLHYLAGARVRRRLQEHELRAASLRILLGTNDDEMVSVIQKRMEELGQAERKTRKLQGQLSDAWTKLLSPLQDPVLAAHFSDCALPMLQALGRKLADQRPDAVIFLTSQVSREHGVFVLAAGSRCKLDIEQAGREVAKILNGKGGGSGRVFQGKAQNLALRDQIPELLSRRLSLHSGD